MYLALTDEQEFLIEAAAGALDRKPTVEAARAVLDGEPAEPLWPIAVEAGWTGLLTGEDADGAGLAPYDAMLVLEECGRRLADARLLGHLPACALLEAAGADADLRGALARGERRAAFVDARLGERSATLDVAGDTVSGTVRGLIDADGADVLVVVGEDGGSSVALVLEADVAGVAIAPRGAYDGTRVLADVSLDGARGTRLPLEPERVGDGADLQIALLAAESVGVADGALAMTRDYAVDRVAFGRAIGSYQAIKHKLVEMLRRIENARSLVVAAGRAWDEDRDRFGLLACAARVQSISALDYTAPETIFVHGGVGATWEHDAMLFYRRGEASRRLCGGADAAADAVADALLATL
jgi:alkylation response protein AidB-like acyl-CoA dehydrogenase